MGVKLYFVVTALVTKHVTMEFVVSTLEIPITEFLFRMFTINYLCFWRKKLRDRYLKLWNWELWNLQWKQYLPIRCLWYVDNFPRIFLEKEKYRKFFNFSFIACQPLTTCEGQGRVIFIYFPFFFIFFYFFLFFIWFS